ncbi:ISL3 family transposase [Laspinema palackyanum]|uniref:ISL3 family transposase n=1 Tax=Laspinema palackyanum TaxID=3231601 RepID=UPI003F53EA0A
MPSKAQCHTMSQLLDLAGVWVKDYKIHKEIGLVLQIESPQKSADCPLCGHQSNKLHQNHWYLVKDLPFSEHPTYLRVNRRQFKCQTCQKPFSESLDYVNPKRNYTKRLTYKVIEEVLESNIQSVARRYEVTEEEIQTMLEDVGSELLKEKPAPFRRLGIDEISQKKGQGNYCAVLVDIDAAKPVAIVDSRRKEELLKVLQGWGSEILKSIEEVSIDLWMPYKTLVEELLPHAQIVADRFHLMKGLNEELDAQRKFEKYLISSRKSYPEKSDFLSAINKSKYALVKNEKDLTENQTKKLNEVKVKFPQLAIMHDLKEEFRDIFESKHQGTEGLVKLVDWLFKAQQSFPTFTKTVIRWFPEIVNYFENRTSNGVVEGINNKLKVIKKSAYGLPKFENFRLRSLLNWMFT